MFGNDFSSVQAADLQQQGLDQQASQAALNRLIAVNQANRQMALQQQQIAYQQQVANPQEWEFRNRQLGIEQDLATRRIAAEQDRNEISRGYLDAYTRQIPQQTTSQMKDAEFAFNSAASDAERGLFSSPEEVGKYYPQLSDGQRQLMAQRSQAVRPLLQQQYEAGDRAANLLNTYDMAHQTLEDYKYPLDAKEPPIISTTGDPKLVAHDLGIPEKAVKKASWWGDSADEVQRKTAIIKAWTVKNHLEQSGNLQQLRRSAGVAYDPQSQKWSNTVVQPRWLQPGSAAPTTQPPQAPAGPVLRQPIMTGQRQMPQAFYDRVNQYAAQGLSLPDASSRAMADWNSAQSAGNLP